jgi:small subunit ribosomal protein S20
MANIKSQIKRIETNRKAEARNRAVRTELKSAVKAVREASTKGDRQAAAEALKNANRKLDKAVSKGVLHKNQAANRKSAITKKVSSL